MSLVRSSGPDHAAAIRQLLVRPAELCRALGLTEGYRPVRQAGGGLLIRCPSHGDRSPSCSVRLGPDGTLAVHCFACGFTGDALTLIASVRGLDVHRPDDFRQVLDEGAALAGYDLHADPDPRGPPAPRPLPAPPPPPTYPPAEEVSALWTLARPLSTDAAALTYLAGRGLDAEALERLDLVRALPRGARVPSWARCGLPWPASGHRLLLPVYDASGELGSLRAWRLDGQDPKRVAPAGHSTAGLVLANAAGRQLLATGQADVDLVVVEGEPDFLTWALAGEGHAVLGIVAHAWTPALAARLPDGVRVALRVHRDAAGDKYAAALTTSLAERGELYDFPRPSEGEHRDENEQHQAGELPVDPFEGLQRARVRSPREAPRKTRARSLTGPGLPGPRAESRPQEAGPASGERRQGARRATPGRREEDARPPADARHFVEITNDLHLVIDAATAALAADTNLNLYVRDAALVQVLRSTEIEKGRRDAGAPLVRAIQPATLRELMTTTATWGKYDGRRKGMIDCVPNDHVVQGTFHRGQWPGLRSLVGVLETPFLRPDGSVCQTPGYDAETGYLLISTERFPDVLEAPTQQQAAAALAELTTELFSDFPFVAEVDRHVPIAALLTLLARPAIGSGNTPAFLFDANNRGTGKSLLTNAVCLVATGRVAPKTGYPIDDGEMSKLLAGVAREACALLSFDNLVSSFGGGSIERALTCEGSTHFRILGLTATQTSTWRTVLFATGNNVAVFGDTTRRTIVCRQETDLERPETRETFRHPDLLDWIAAHRHHLVSLALTVLRGFCAAGCPKTVKPLGSFEAWAKLVAGAIVWAGGPDVTAAIADASQPNSDPEKGAIGAVLQNWCKLDPERRGLSLKAALERLYPPRRTHEPPPPPDGLEALREALETLDKRRRGSEPPDAGRLGYPFRKYRRRTLGGLRLDSEKDRKETNLWRVDPVSGVAREEQSAGDAGDDGDVLILRAETVMATLP